MNFGNINIEGLATLTEQSTPTAYPSTGSDYLYFKADGKLYSMNYLGIETMVLSDAPNDGNVYARQSGCWQNLSCRFTTQYWNFDIGNKVLNPLTQTICGSPAFVGVEIYSCGCNGYTCYELHNYDSFCGCGNTVSIGLNRCDPYSMVFGNTALGSVSVDWWNSLCNGYVLTWDSCNCRWDAQPISGGSSGCYPDIQFSNGCGGFGYICYPYCNHGYLYADGYGNYSWCTPGGGCGGSYYGLDSIYIDGSNNIYLCGDIPNGRYDCYYYGTDSYGNKGWFSVSCIGGGGSVNNYYFCYYCNYPAGSSTDIQTNNGCGGFGYICYPYCNHGYLYADGYGNYSWQCPSGCGGGSSYYGECSIAIDCCNNIHLVNDCCSIPPYYYYGTASCWNTPCYNKLWNITSFSAYTNYGVTTCYVGNNNYALTDPYTWLKVWDGCGNQYWIPAYCSCYGYGC